MILSDSFDYLLKSYMRQHSFTLKEVAKICKVKDSVIETWIQGKQLPEPKEVIKIQECTKIPKLIIWRAWFRSFARREYLGSDIDLVDYQEYEDCIKNSRKKRKLFKKKSIPGDEAWLDIFDKKDMPLNGLNLASTLRLAFKRKKGLKTAIKNSSLSKKKLKAFEKGELPSLKDLFLLKNSIGLENTANSIVRAYMCSMIKKYKLNFYIIDVNENDYKAQLTRLY